MPVLNNDNIDIKNFLGSTIVYAATKYIKFYVYANMFYDYIDGVSVPDITNLYANAGCTVGNDGEWYILSSNTSFSFRVNSATGIIIYFACKPVVEKPVSELSAKVLISESANNLININQSSLVNHASIVLPDQILSLDLLSWFNYCHSSEYGTLLSWGDIFETIELGDTEIWTAYCTKKDKPSPAQPWGSIRLKFYKDSTLKDTSSTFTLVNNYFTDYSYGFYNPDGDGSGGNDDVVMKVQVEYLQDDMITWSPGEYITFNCTLYGYLNLFNCFNAIRDSGDHKQVTLRFDMVNQRPYTQYPDLQGKIGGNVSGIYGLTLPTYGLDHDGDGIQVLNFDSPVSIGDTIDVYIDGALGQGDYNVIVT